jgi:hypothetical protein
LCVRVPGMLSVYSGSRDFFFVFYLNLNVIVINGLLCKPPIKYPYKKESL